MKDLSVHKEFIRLKIAGMSLQSISDKIGVSKKTLIRWGRIHENDISAGICADMNEVLEEFRVKKQDRVIDLAIIRKAMLDAVAKKVTEFAVMPLSSLLEALDRNTLLLMKETYGIDVKVDQFNILEFWRTAIVKPTLDNAQGILGAYNPDGTRRKVVETGDKEEFEKRLKLEGS